MARDHRIVLINHLCEGSTHQQVNKKNALSFTGNLPFLEKNKQPRSDAFWIFLLCNDLHRGVDLSHNGHFSGGRTLALARDKDAFIPLSDDLISFLFFLRLSSTLERNSRDKSSPEFRFTDENNLVKQCRAAVHRAAGLRGIKSDSEKPKVNSNWKMTSMCVCGGGD